MFEHGSLFQSYVIAAELLFFRACVFLLIFEYIFGIGALVSFLIELFS